MTELKIHPAVFAGLLGSAAWGVPEIALASPVDDVMEAVAGSVVLQFAIGCAAGAAIAGVIAYVADRMPAKSEEVEPVAQAAAEDDRWSSSSLNLVRAQALEADDDPTGDLGRFRTGQITIDLPVEEVKKSVAAKASGKARHFAAAAPAQHTAKPAAKRTGRHFATAAKQEPLVISLLSPEVASVAHGRHFAGNVPAPAPKPVDVAPAAPKPVMPEPAAVAEPARPVDPREQLRERLSKLPTIDSRYAKPVRPVVEVATVSAAAAPKPAVSAQPAARVDARSRERSSSDAGLGVTGRLRMRMAERTRNVREVLAARLSGDVMEGVPIIQRADGSVSDVAPAPTWFDQTLAPAIASLTGITGKLDDTAARSDFEGAAESSASVPAAADDSRATYISRRVAEVNEGMFPERRSADELEHEDVWEQALAAMGEAIAEEAPVFQDMVGGPATIDDPDGLEGPTGFIPFRVPAAHPEVVDTETYVDYLLRDELSHNSSLVIRKSSHAHLRVIEGGTSPLRIRKRTGDDSTTGRHFAPARMAQEA